MIYRLGHSWIKGHWMSFSSHCSFSYYFWQGCVLQPLAGIWTFPLCKCCLTWLVLASSVCSVCMHVVMYYWHDVFYVLHVLSLFVVKVWSKISKPTTSWLCCGNNVVKMSIQHTIEIALILRIIYQLRKCSPKQMNHISLWSVSHPNHHRAKALC